MGKNEEEDLPIFHATLADPNQYVDGVYSRSFVIDKGEYRFRFVPNGDSPQNLEISVKGEDFEFFENFSLNGALHQTGISEYYTWDYDGIKSLKIKTQQTIEITINPKGNIMGPVSVSLIEN